jgi:hypothetical protein
VRLQHWAATGRLGRPGVYFELAGVGPTFLWQFSSLGRGTPGWVVVEPCGRKAMRSVLPPSRQPRSVGNHAENRIGPVATIHSCAPRKKKKKGFVLNSSRLARGADLPWLQLRAGLTMQELGRVAGHHMQMRS